MPLSRFFRPSLELAFVGNSAFPSRICNSSALAAGYMCPVAMLFVIQIMLIVKIQSVSSVQNLFSPAVLWCAPFLSSSASWRRIYALCSLFRLAVVTISSSCLYIYSHQRSSSYTLALQNFFILSRSSVLWSIFSFFSCSHVGCSSPHITRP